MIPNKIILISQIVYCPFTTVGPFWYYKRTETKKQNANEGNATNNEVF